eukprot:161542-Chlamydomonas_euryale.AAC.1
MHTGVNHVTALLQCQPCDGNVLTAIVRMRWRACCSMWAVQLERHHAGSRAGAPIAGGTAGAPQCGRYSRRARTRQLLPWNQPFGLVASTGRPLASNTTSVGASTPHWLVCSHYTSWRVHTKPFGAFKLHRLASSHTLVGGFTPHPLPLSHCTCWRVDTKPVVAFKLHLLARSHQPGWRFQTAAIGPGAWTPGPTAAV